MVVFRPIAPIQVRASRHCLRKQRKQRPRRVPSSSVYGALAQVAGATRSRATSACGTRALSRKATQAWVRRSPPQMRHRSVGSRSGGARTKDTGSVRHGQMVSASCVALTRGNGGAIRGADRKSKDLPSVKAIRKQHNPLPCEFQSSPEPLADRGPKRRPKARLMIVGGAAGTRGSKCTRRVPPESGLRRSQRRCPPALRAIEIPVTTRGPSSTTSSIRGRRGWTESSRRGP